ncbi:ferric reductase-like transmembrane component [Lasiosphaeris hirsuta]|uniref:Ferric reductase-like transmembrane component n=1 Tax=Lasiosphaeris hirsuta TaxID=260670 RepID=A0AA39ZPH1_9PEZI|nr:ferric reductase-like transmembrane component [Lasiosphaeris hirsuta]
MKMPSAAWLALPCLVSPAVAQVLVGFGNVVYDPLCAESCLRSLTSYMLDCSGMGEDHDGMEMMSMPMTADCYAHSTPFLTSVAWCMSTKCAGQDIALSRMEHWWEQTVTGSRTLAAKWSYSAALLNVDPSPPTYQLGAADTALNVTSIVEPNTYLKQWNVLGGVRDETIIESAYSIAIFVVGVGLPLALTWIPHLPFGRTLADKLKPYLVYPSLIGTYQVRPLPFLLGNAPTVGQGFYMAAFLALNVVLTSVNYQSRQPSAWFGSQWNEISAYVMYRTGIFGYMILPLVILFSSRNNILLWWSNWSHSTYLVLHRWVGRLFMLYAVIHSVIGLQIYATYATTGWWAWGAVATVASVLLTLGSSLHVRRPQYELFLTSHILLAVFVVVGCWYHLIGWYASMGMFIPYTSGMEFWLYLAIALWFLDRLVRVGRVVKSGARRAHVLDLGAGYIRIDIPGIRWGFEPGKHAYVYFPTLSPLRPWENHPFSIVPTALLQHSGRSEAAGSLSKGARDDEENQPTTTATGGTFKVGTDSDAGIIGVTLLIKKSAGLTKHLQPHAGLLTLLDGPYSNSDVSALLRCDRLLVLAGGIGITGVLPYAYSHWNVKLAWSVSESARCLAEAVDLSGVSSKEVYVGSRLDIYKLVYDEADSGWGRIGVVASGPGGFCDDVRAAVTAAGRKGTTVFELEIDAYSW